MLLVVNGHTGSNETLMGVLLDTKKGFNNSHSNPSLFVKKSSSSITILFIYVDDILLTRSDSHKYVTELLSKVGMLDCKSCATPSALKSSTSTSDCLPFTNLSLYRSLVGDQQYLTITRPDIALAINQAVKRLLRYIKGTLTHYLHFTSRPLVLQAFSDSNWVGDTIDRISTSGFCVFLGSNLISWSAKKQNTVSRSSTEAKYRSLTHIVVEMC
ncbi:uncharacterized protein LOC114265636 [Camellia sinensis]|uniref:uncharacterized protein LOC114265636 n=1 Tax=Camellia sinensis TaxID=4442 RepID=UPI0010366BCC|nr:uncharacterized protein LOC114265636 [Camellia sinensis]